MDHVRQLQGAPRWGAYAREAGRAGDGELRSQKMLRYVLLYLLRTGFLVFALYGVYSRHEVYVWLFGILLVHSLLDGQFYLKPTLLEAYLLFTVVFYFQRYVMGWGAENTIFKEDAPNWVRVIKDVVWATFTLGVIVKFVMRPRFPRRTPLWATAAGQVFVGITLVYACLPVLALMYGRGSLFDIVLYDLRFPLEYIPIIFLMPFLLEGRSGIRFLRFFVPLILITLMFLAFEVSSGRPTASGWGGIHNRYGSIFGSPNDFGMFLTLSLTVMLGLLAERAIRWTAKVIGLMALCLCALASTVSLSSIFAMVVATLTLSLFARNKVRSAMTLFMVALFAIGLYFAFPRASVSSYLTERIENLRSLREGSAYGHYLAVVEVEDAVARFSGPEYLVGTFTSRDEMMWPETYYLRTLYTRGAVSLGALLLMIFMSIRQAHRRYRAASGNPEQRGLFLALMASVVAFAFGSIFNPYFDMFPSNFYFWFLVAILWCEPEQRKAPTTALESPLRAVWQKDMERQWETVGPEPRY